MTYHTTLRFSGKVSLPVIEYHPVITKTEEALILLTAKISPEINHMLSRDQLHISLHFMPAFYTRHLGVTYGEAYYFDPGYRAEVERAESRWLYESLGRYGVGSRAPQPSANLFIQPVDLVMRTQGAAWRFPADATLESVGTPWAGMSPAEIDRIEPADAAHHPVIDAILAQYRELQRRYGDRADVFGMKTGLMNIHTPYTTTHQLYGEELFLLMADDPDGARIVFDKVWQIYRAIFARLTETLGARLTHLQLGDCSASLLSPALYREVVLPVNQSLAAAFPAAGYHSCGPSTHLLPDFTALPHLDGLQLGPGTDLALANRLFPTMHLQPLIDPLLMRDGTPDSVYAAITTILTDTASAPELTLCAWSFDRETPVENVAAMYEAVAAV